MSIFKTKWIITKISKLQKNEFLYTIFSYDYWKIKAAKKTGKKEKNLDLWYIINFEIETKEKKEIHSIRNIKINSEFKYENKNFNIINKYLELLSIINKQIPDWISVYEIFNIIDFINNKENVEDTNLILSKIKILLIIWGLKINTKNQNIIKIIKFIEKNNIKDIFRLTWIDENTKKELENF